MATYKLTLDQLREQVQKGSKLTLVENFYFNRNILIGKERVLSEKDIDRMEGKIHEIGVKEFKAAGCDDQVKNSILQLCIRILKEHKDYKGLLAEKRKRVETIITNILPSHDYASMRLAQLKKISSRLFLHSVNTAIKALIVDMAWQARHNQGLQDSIRTEEILIGSLLRNIGFLRTSKETICQTFGQLRASDNELLKKVPALGVEIFDRDRDKHDLSPNIKRIIAESYENSDGSGFPNNLSKEDIYQPALTIATCAEFDLLLGGELSQNERSYMEINRRIMALANKFDKATINIIGEEFRYIRDTRG